MSHVSHLVRRDTGSSSLSPGVIAVLIVLLILILLSIVSVGLLYYIRSRRQNGQLGGKYGPELPMYNSQCSIPPASSEKQQIVTAGQPGRESTSAVRITATANGQTHAEYLVSSDNGGRTNSAMPRSLSTRNEKDAKLHDNWSDSDSGLPEIRITFPEEVDEKTGNRVSGRSVVVNIGESGNLGLQPVHEDEKRGIVDPDSCLPPYTPGEFQNLDLNSIGGLKEKKF